MRWPPRAVLQIKCSEVITDGSADIPGWGAKKFLEAFARKKLAIVIAQEYEQGVLPDPETTCFFTVEKIERRPLKSSL
ncbi:MAG: hypothetical protein WDN10_01255 [bacterium]